MKNNKGFTLVEIISVVVILGLLAIISIPIVSNVSESIKMKALDNKIENIKKAAVLYGQQHRENFTDKCKMAGEPCEDMDTSYDCSCYDIDYIRENGVYKNIIEANELIENGLIKEDIVKDGKKLITNPMDENKNLNECTLRLYQKYGKIYVEVIKFGDNCG